MRKRANQEKVVKLKNQGTINALPGPRCPAKNAKLCKIDGESSKIYALVDEKKISRFLRVEFTFVSMRRLYITLRLYAWISPKNVVFQRRSCIILSYLSSDHT